MARHDARVNHDSLLFINAAVEGFDSASWTAPKVESNFSRIRDTLLLPAGVTEKQVQVAWVQMMTNFPARPLPIQDADAYRLKGALAETLRELKTRYPNLQIAYLSSRVYGGYAISAWNPEPFAYESAFSVRWIITGQIIQMRTGFVPDTRIGSIDYKRRKRRGWRGGRISGRTARRRDRTASPGNAKTSKPTASGLRRAAREKRQPCCCSFCSPSRPR